MEITLLQKGNRGEAGNKSRESQNTGKIIVKSEGETYANLVKKIKTNIDITQTGVKIKSLRKTLKGDLLLEVEGGEEKTKTMMRKIAEKNLFNEIVVTGRSTTVHISDIDADISKEDLRNEIKKNSGEGKSENIKVLNMWPNRIGNQTAAVELEQGLARKLLKIGELKIGWTLCKIRKRINITRSFKCLLHGHKTKECKGPDRSGDCMKCGQSGHKAKDYKNKDFCTPCKEEGHRADQTKCPHFRRLIREKVEEGRKK